MSQVVAVAPALPEHRHTQAEITDAFAEVVLPAGMDRGVLDRLHQATGVTQRHLALPLADYPGLAGFGAANDAFIEVGTKLGARAIGDALDVGGTVRVDDAAVRKQLAGVLEQQDAVAQQAPSLLRVAGNRVRGLPVGGLG